MRLACYQPDIALNVGAMIRTCACFDVGLDIIEPCGFAFSLQAVKRSAMDYAMHLDIQRHVSWDDFYSNTHQRIILLSTKGSKSFWDMSYQPDDIFLVGRESSGVPEGIHNQIQDRVYIPTQTQTRSLNVGVAAAIVLAEAKRQL